MYKLYIIIIVRILSFQGKSIELLLPCTKSSLRRIYFTFFWSSFMQNNTSTVSKLFVSYTHGFPRHQITGMEIGYIERMKKY